MLGWTASRARERDQPSGACVLRPPAALSRLALPVLLVHRCKGGRMQKMIHIPPKRNCGWQCMLEQFYGYCHSLVRAVEGFAPSGQESQRHFRPHFGLCLVDSWRLPADASRLHCQGPKSPVQGCFLKYLLQGMREFLVQAGWLYTMFSFTHAPRSACTSAFPQQHTMGQSSWSVEAVEPMIMYSKWFDSKMQSMLR